MSTVRIGNAHRELFKVKRVLESYIYPGGNPLHVENGEREQNIEGALVERYNGEKLFVSRLSCA